MVSTRSGGGVTPPDRTTLQLQRDKIAAQVNMGWTINDTRPSSRSRGINNGPQLCYQNAVLQVLMHQPPFRNWIGQHNMTVAPCLTTPCLKCHLRRLVDTYWGPANPNSNPIPRVGSIQGIANSSFTSPYFTPGVQDDAYLFYSWIIDELRGVPTTPARELQLDMLFMLTLQHNDRCTVCGMPHSSKNLSNETSICVGVDINHTTIQQAIHATLRHNVTDIYCKGCKANQTKTRWTEIVAAPKILRVQLQILQYQHKIFHALTYPDVLNLTAYQQEPTLPLQYQLSSVIAHSGNFQDSIESDVRMAKLSQRNTDKQAQMAADRAMGRRLQAGLYAGTTGDSSEKGNGSEDGEEEVQQEDGEDEDDYESDASEVEVEEEEEEEEEEAEGGETEDQDSSEEGTADSEVDNDTDSDFGDICRGTDNADSSALATSEVEESESSEMDATDLDALGKELNPPEKAKVPDKVSEKVMRGHYIASVRERGNTFSRINDSGVTAITHQQFLTNPQQSNGQKFQVYILTYIRDDSGKNMPALMSERWMKESAQLEVSKGADKQIIHPTVDSEEHGVRSRKRMASQEGYERGEKRKRS